MMLYVGNTMPAESRIVPSVRGDLAASCDTSYTHADKHVLHMD